MENTETVTAHLATIPERVEHAQAVVDGMLQQVDRVTIYLSLQWNDFPPEKWMNDARIEVYQSGPRDIGDAGKFIGHDEPGWHLTIDDDLVYPNDYVAQTIGRARVANRPVTWHGSILNPRPIERYLGAGRKRVFRCTKLVANDVLVDVPGSGVFGYHTRMMRPAIKLSEFKQPNMADVWLAVALRVRGWRALCLKHPEGYIKHRNIDLGRTIHARASRRGTKLEAAIINQHFPN